eukprot:5481034-Pleurochrysis_carterae.AAC.1
MKYRLDAWKPSLRGADRAMHSRAAAATRRGGPATGAGARGGGIAYTAPVMCCHRGNNDKSRRELAPFTCRLQLVSSYCCAPQRSSLLYCTCSSWRRGCAAVQHTI